MRLQPVTAESIYYKPFKPRPALVEGLIVQGLTILAGTAKIGKSWMMLDLAISVASGTPFLGKPVRQAGVLYLCLEDTEERIRDRMHELVDEPPDDLYFSTSSDRLGSGFISSVRDMLRDHRSIELVIVDTLQLVRGSDDGSGGGVYSKDYEELSKIKELADLNGKSLIAVHHLRKNPDRDDPFNEISGSTAMSGASDTNIVLKRAEGMKTAVMHLRGRDIEEHKLVLEYNFPRWKILEDVSADELAREKIPEALFHIADFIRERGSWSGSATQLLDQVDDHSIPVNKLMQKITKYYYDVFYPAGITFERRTENRMRRIILTYDPKKDTINSGQVAERSDRSGDDSDSSDDTTGI